MALEEFILDLCEESVNAALLVGSPDFQVAQRRLTRTIDILAIPNLPTRSLRESTVRSIQNMQEGI